MTPAHAEATKLWPARPTRTAKAAKHAPVARLRGGRHLERWVLPDCAGAERDGALRALARQQRYGIPELQQPHGAGEARHAAADNHRRSRVLRGCGCAGVRARRAHGGAHRRKRGGARRAQQRAHAATGRRVEAARVAFMRARSRATDTRWEGGRRVRGGDMRRRRRQTRRCSAYRLRSRCVVVRSCSCAHCTACCGCTWRRSASRIAASSAHQTARPLLLLCRCGRRHGGDAQRRQARRAG